MTKEQKKWAKIRALQNRLVQALFDFDGPKPTHPEKAESSETHDQNFVIGLNEKPDGTYLLLDKEHSWMFRYSDHTFRGNPRMSIDKFHETVAEIAKHNWQCEYITKQTDVEQRSLYFSIDKRFVFGKPNRIFIHETIVRRAKLNIGGLTVRPMTDEEKAIAKSSRGRGNIYLTVDDVNTGNEEILPSQKKNSWLRMILEYGKKTF